MEMYMYCRIELGDDLNRIDGHQESGARVKNAPRAKDLLSVKIDAKRKTYSFLRAGYGQALYPPRATVYKLKMAIGSIF
jgi:hypothetical protein